MDVFGSGWRGWRWVEWMTGLGLALPILWEHGECWTCICGLVALVWVGSGLGPGSARVVLCLCEL